MFLPWELLNKTNRVSLYREKNGASHQDRQTLFDFFGEPTSLASLRKYLDEVGGLLGTDPTHFHFGLGA